MPLNERLLRLSVARQGEKVLVKKIRPLVELDFNTKKDEFLEEFDNHPVTQEIAQGPHANSQVQALALTGGNLFSFLGFSQNQQPMMWLRNYFDKNIKLGPTHAGKIVGKKIQFTTSVKFPTVQEINSAVAKSGDTELDWTNRSFTDVLDKGVPGLPKFIFDESRFTSPPSRSGTGLQSKGELGGSDMPRIKYIPELLATIKRLFTRPRR